MYVCDFFTCFFIFIPWLKRNSMGSFLYKRCKGSRADLSFIFMIQRVSKDCGCSPVGSVSSASASPCGVSAPKRSASTGTWGWLCLTKRADDMPASGPPDTTNSVAGLAGCGAWSNNPASSCKNRLQVRRFPSAKLCLQLLSNDF